MNAMATKGQKIKLALFVAATALLVLGMFSLFGRVALWAEQKTYYVLVPKSAEGLELGAPVKLRGVPVGVVDAMQPLADGFLGVKVTLKLDPNARVKKDDKAYLQYKGLTGLKIIDIAGGTSASPFAGSGDSIEFAPSPLDQLTDQADVLAREITSLVRTTNQFVDRLNAVTREFDAGEVGALLKNADLLLSRLNEASQNIERLSADAAKQVPSTLASADQAFQSAEQVMATLERTAAEAEKTVSGVGRSLGELSEIVERNDDELNKTVHSLHRASRNFEVLSRELRQRPSRILFSSPPKERELD